MRINKDFSAFVDSAGGGLEKKIATLLFNPCFHSVCLYRLSSFLYIPKLRFNVLSKIVWYLNRIIFNVDIDYRADLAGGVVLVHGLGTVIGKDVQSEGRVYIYQVVTLGGTPNGIIREDSSGKKIVMPLLKDNVRIYTGAIVVGGVIVEENSIIKAGRIVTSNIDRENVCSGE